MTMNPLTSPDASMLERAQTPPLGDHAAAAEILAVQSLSPHDKVRLFVEEQRRECRAGIAEEAENSDPLVESPPLVLTDGDGDDNDGDINKEEEITYTPIATSVHEQNGDKKNKKSQMTTAGRKRNDRGVVTIKTRNKSNNHNKTKNTETGVDDDALLLFRRSQKALRKEAQHVSMREVLCRSLPTPVDGLSETSNPFSPTGCSQSSAWSPSIATNLTNKFLSNVQRQKQQTFERLIQREITNSQLSFSHLTDDLTSEECVPELIIGDETAVMIPPATDGGSNDFLLMDKEAYLPHGGHSASRALEEHDEEAAQAQSEALRRKHQLWRLRQRHLREQMHVVGEDSSVKRGEDIIASAHAAMAAATVSTRAPPAAGDAEGPFDVVMMTQRITMHRRHSGTLRLSADHIDMIRRVNSFGNTSSQRVALFEAQNSKQGVSKKGSLS